MSLSGRTYGYQGKNDGYADAYAYNTVPNTEAQSAGSHNGVVDVSALVVEEQVVDERSFCAKECAGFAGILFRCMNLLLVFVPIGIYSHLQDWTSAARFTFNFIAIVPLAGILGASTESLACHTGQMIGGLLNATFGNAVEMIVTINAIRSNLVDVVQGSLLGSILSNLLLVMGMAFFAAGMVEKESRFSAKGANANITCLCLGAIGLLLPTIYMQNPDAVMEDCLHISRISSLVIAMVYLLFLIFQLKTHADVFGSPDGEEEEEAPLSVCSSVVVLLVSTCAVAVCSEFLVASIEGVTEEYGLPEAFIGVILLPIVGNAAEHATAVTVAAKGKMDLAIGVAVGSSTQIALFVVPFSVIVGWFCDVEMSLDFRVFDSAVMILAVFLANSVLHDGSSNWLEGAMLIATYILISIICWYIPSKAKP